MTTSPPSLTLRELRATDRPQWAELWRDYLAFYETALPEPAYTRAFERMLSGADGEFHGIVAEHGGALIGLAHALLHRHGWREEPVCYLQDLYVAPAARGTGAGRALIEAVYTYADDQGAADVYWLTQDFNHTARALYDSVAGLTPFIKYSRNAR